MGLKLIKGIKKEPKKQPDWVDIWSRQLEKHHKENHIEGVIFAGIKLFNILHEPITEEDAIRKFEFNSLMQGLIGDITPRQLVQLFPIKKSYDGKKWECVDYFSTMEELKEHGLDTPLGDDALKIMMSYDNMEIRFFVVKGLGCMDVMRRVNGEQGMLKEFFGSELTTYTKFTSNSKEYIKNNKTGETSAIKKKIPRYIKLI